MKKERAIWMSVFVGIVLVGVVVLGWDKFNVGQNLAQISAGPNSPQLILLKVGEGKATLLDVRTDEEWNAGHAIGAIHFDVTRMQNGELPQVAKDSAIYVYCHTGRRAGIAQGILEQNGFTNVTNIGGLSDWEAKDGPVTN